MLISRNSLGTIVDKVRENKHIANKISLDALFAETEEEFKAYLLLFNLKDSIINSKEFRDFVLDSYCIQEAKAAINKNLEKIKGRTFFDNFINYFTGNSGRSLRILYFFIEYLEKQNINFTNDIKSKFLEAMNEFEVSTKDNLKFMFTISSSDKKRLINFVKNELDEVAIHEIISSLPTAKEEIKSTMSAFDQFILKVTFS
jgi:hypothetical protein